MGKCALHVILAIAILGVLVAPGVGGDEPKVVVSVADFHDPESPTSDIQEHGSSDANVITGNLCEGNRDGGLVIVGPGTQVSANLGSFLDRKP